MSGARGAVRTARGLGAAAVAAVLAIAPTARAGPGAGIRFGGGVLHPYLEIEPRWDSNVMLDAGQEIADAVVAVRPGARFEREGTRLALRIDGRLSVVRFMGLEGDTADLSRLDATAEVALEANRDGALGLELGDRFTRGVESLSLSLPNAVVSSANALRLRVPWRPGGGALELAAGGEWIRESFEPYLEGFVCAPVLPGCDSATLAGLGYHELRGNGEVRWRFLPRTAARLRGTWVERLPDDTALSDDGSAVKVMGGLSGLVTSRFAATLEAGFGDTLGSAAEPYSSWLANVELEWIGGEKRRVRVGYTHGFEFDPGSATSLYGSDRVFLDARAAFGRFSLALAASWDRLDYVLTDATSQIVRAEPRLESAVARWLWLGLGYRYTARSSSGSLASLPSWEYARNEAWLSARLEY
ncbi:MAG TPA: hypothetical protein VLS93_05175 [Anaeromyxobacteraceae bacterium]|nr:hypothetical protein [Anaeromyxobacteraceae bacterium]